MTALVADNITVKYARKTVIAGQTLRLESGKITGLIGPNGSGKSTLIKALSGIIPVASGHVTLDGTDLASLSNKDRARQIAYLAQKPQVPEDLTVQNLVKLGRYAYGHGMFGVDTDGKAAIQAAMREAQVIELANRRLDELSGGQRQRAYFAMTLAHHGSVLMLDEPTTYLDLTHQLNLLNLVRQMNQQHAQTVGIVLHDLNQASQFCDRLVCVANGEIVAAGSPAEVLTPALLAAIFQVRADIHVDPMTGQVQLLNYETLVQA